MNRYHIGLKTSFFQSNMIKNLEYISYRIEKESTMRSLIIPNQKQNSHSFLGLILEQVPQIQIPTTRQWLRGLSHQLHLMINRPTNDVNQMVSLQDRVAYVLPTLIVLEHFPVIQFYLPQHRIRDMSVLIQRHRPAFPDREVAVLDPVTVRIGRDAISVQGIVLASREPHLDSNGRVRLRRLPERANHGEPVADRFARRDSPGRDRRDPDQIGAEHVVVLDVELDVGDRVGQGDPEVLVPLRARRVGDDARAGHSCPGEADGDVRVAGDYVAMSLVLAVARERGMAGLEGGEESANALRDQIHVRQAPGLDDSQI
ncbi:LOW QUALITY PROTEIN: hypothetical protein PanWU01x14_307310 [Parasponia andersonii]|uniref:Uncharacterized protein n=1 Tax=Parasponia andersonii TaxID=3476 RepID=A0A2P5ARC1_PARAD|nr:LOW QUALITY PROTEIN: hypothetical protein PanWU01x14_307310 [Parasponia andersonii]